MPPIIRPKQTTANLKSSVNGKHTQAVGGKELWDKTPKNKISEALRSLIVPVSSLKLDPLNARLHPVKNMDSIKDSLCLYGQRKCIVVRRDNMTIAAGNGTYQAAIELGWSHIAAAIDDMTETEAAGYGLADNRTAELARWDLDVVEKLNNLLIESNHCQVGWDLGDLENLRRNDWKNVDTTPTGGDDFDGTPDTGPAIAKLGDLWLIDGGRHRLVCGDSTDPEVVRLVMDGQKGILMATDPPYGVDFKGQKYNPRAKDWDGIIGDQEQGVDLENFLGRVLSSWLPIMKDESAFYFWTAAMAEGFAAYNAILRSGLHVQSQIIWNKNTLVLGKVDYHWKHENCWYAFWKGKKHRWYGQRDKVSVWDISRVANALYEHPMQKPTELYAIPMRHHTKKDEIVVEPFAGSGSQYVAAHRLERRCFGCEIDPKYVDVILKRCEREGLTIEKSENNGKS